MLNTDLGVGDGRLEAGVGDDGEGLVADFLGIGKTVVANEDFHKGADAGYEITREHAAIIHMLLNVCGKIRDRRSGQVHRLRQRWRGGGPIPSIGIGRSGAVLIPLLLAERLSLGKVLLVKLTQALLLLRGSLAYLIVPSLHLLIMALLIGLENRRHFLQLHEIGLERVERGLWIRIVLEAERILPGVKQIALGVAITCAGELRVLERFEQGNSDVRLPDVVVDEAEIEELAGDAGTGREGGNVFIADFQQGRAGGGIFIIKRETEEKHALVGGAPSVINLTE